MSRLTQLVYVSRPASDLTVEQVQDLLVGARQRNAENGLTGALVFRYDHFVQVLEGDRARVWQTFGKILNDSRHHDVELVGFHAIRTRRFATWRMAYLALDETARSSILRHSPTDEFAPADMDADSIVELLADLAADEPVHPEPVPA